MFFAGCEEEDNLPPSVSDQTFVVQEGAAPGTVVGTVVAHDPEGSALTYSIQSQTPSAQFNIDSKTGAIIVNEDGVISGEAEFFMLEVRVADKHNHASSATITIEVENDEEDNLPPSASDAVFYINEDAAPGTAAGTIEAEDPDGDLLIYAIESQEPSEQFTIDSLTGTIVVSDSAILADSSYILVVKIADTENNYTSVVVTINIVQGEEFEMVLRPGADGKDAIIHSLHPDNNYGNHPQLLVSAWTDGGAPYITRAFFDFDLSSIPAGATILEAELTLYHHIANGNDGHSQISGTNHGVLKQVTEAWGESTITWNNQPATTDANAITVEASTSTTQNYVFDLTSMIEERYLNPGERFGFMVNLQMESYYRSLAFGSGDAATPDVHPQLVVRYSVPGIQ